MATSVSRIQAQIAKLQQQADAMKQAALKRVQREIDLHGLTAEDLFGNAGTASSGRKAKSAGAKSATAKTAKAPKYGDQAGNTWGGMGKRPQWLRDALDGGSSLEDFLLGQQSPAQPTPAPKPRAGKSRRAAKPAAKSATAAKKSRSTSGTKKAATKRRGSNSAAAQAAEAAE